MLGVWIILLLLFCFLSWILIAPIRLNLDSLKNNYLINWGGLGSLTLVPNEQNWFFRLKIGFWEKKFFILGLIEKMMRSDKKEQKPKELKSKKRKKKKRSNFFSSLRKARYVLESFKIKVCKIDFDSDDYYWNALLIPAFQLLNRGDQHRIAMNFKGKNDILLIVEIRLIKILYSIFIKN